MTIFQPSKTNFESSYGLKFSKPAHPFYADFSRRAAQDIFLIQLCQLIRIVNRFRCLATDITA